MCTLTWIYSDDGYELFFNRDELRVRGTAVPPVVTQIEGMPCIFPEDSDSGGTWIGVNESGFSACLLNYYSFSGAHEPREYVSRGLLLKSLLDCTDGRSAIERIGESLPGSYRPFSLLLFGPAGPPVLVLWAGGDEGLEFITNPSMPQSSSSFRTAEVIGSRTSLFASLYRSGDLDSTGALKFHRSHEPDRGPFSVCMHREDAKTVSFSRVVVTSDAVVFSYVPGSPCVAEPLPSVTIQRRKLPGPSA